MLCFGLLQAAAVNTSTLGTTTILTLDPNANAIAISNAVEMSTAAFVMSAIALLICIPVFLVFFRFAISICL